jgi:hypothetical protein
VRARGAISDNTPTVDKVATYIGHLIAQCKTGQALSPVVALCVVHQHAIDVVSLVAEMPACRLRGEHHHRTHLPAVRPPETREGGAFYLK